MPAIQWFMSKCSNYQCNQSGSNLVICGQIGWCMKIGSMVGILQNLDPHPGGGICWWRAVTKAPLQLNSNVAHVTTFCLHRKIISSLILSPQLVKHNTYN
jgi:hypothetical protein